MKQRQHAFCAFTLAELLIALAILGVIATFTIPKVLQAQQDERYNAIAKEAAATVAQAYNLAKLSGNVNAATSSFSLLPYINYIKAVSDGSLDIDATPGGAAISWPCDVAAPCLFLANGSILKLSSTSFNGTSSTNAIQFVVDPNGKQDIFTTADGPGKSVQFELYYDGFITSRANAKANSCHSQVCPFGPSSAYDPSWFHWN